ncbi:MAG TPA: FUN14 domain-containing protein [Candidatus Xenobia bacterium]|jgi:uncharacterized membrane protein (Fun14 family)
MDNPLSQLVPWQVIGAQVGFGLVAGFCVGYAFKKLTLVLAIMIGIAMIALQFLVYYGLVNVNWTGVQHAYAAHTPDLNGLWAILSANVPYAGAFSVGFVGGFRKG